MIRLAMFSSIATIVALLAAPAAHGIPSQDVGLDLDAAKHSTLAVEGRAEIQVAADRVRMSVSVVTQAAQPEASLAENSRRMDEVVEALEDLGLTKDEYETGRFTITPQYDPRPRRLEEDWEPSIIGYQTTNAITVRTGRLDLTGRIIQTAVEAGATNVGGLAFELSNERPSRREAIKAATEAAIDDAETLAGACSTKLGRILSISLDDARSASHQVAFADARMRLAAESGGPPAIAPGNITVSARVTIVYQLLALQ